MPRLTTPLLLAAASSSWLALGFARGAFADEDRVWEGHLYVGPPTSPSSLGHYWSPDGLQHSSPLENFILPHAPADVMVVNSPPGGSWRPLFDVSVDRDDPNAALDLKRKAADWGADAVMFDPTMQRLLATLGTAIRIAKPGAEAYTGIFCATYSPYNGKVRERIGNVSLATVQQAEGPAGAAGVQNGDFILSTVVNGKTVLGNCSDLNAALQKAGPGATVDMTLGSRGTAGIRRSSSASPSRGRSEWRSRPNSPVSRSST